MQAYTTHPRAVRLGLVLAVASLGGVATIVRADPYNNPGPFLPPVPSQLHAAPPGPEHFPGKEYTDTPDLDAHTGMPARSQIVLWDGLGGVMNGPTPVPNPALGIPNGHDIDAQVNENDALFNAVISESAHLIVSVEDDAVPGGGRVPLFWEAPLGPALAGIWALPNQVNANAGVIDLNSVEIWGPEPDVALPPPGTSDTTHVSYSDDPGPLGGPPGSGYPIWQVAGAVTNPWLPGGPYGAVPMTDLDIANAIGFVGDPDMIDLDGLMMNVIDHQIMFSIETVLPLDGGEIWVWDYFNRAPGAAGWLTHGGHQWDTAWSVSGEFGTVSENIDALEAICVPEPGTWVAGGALGLIAVAALRRRLARA